MVDRIFILKALLRDQHIIHEMIKGNEIGQKELKAMESDLSKIHSELMRDNNTVSAKEGFEMFVGKQILSQNQCADMRYKEG